MPVSIYFAGVAPLPTTRLLGSAHSQRGIGRSRDLRPIKRGEPDGHETDLHENLGGAAGAEGEEENHCTGGGGGEIRTGESRRVSGYDSKLMRMAGSCKGSSGVWACEVNEHSSSSLILTPLSPKRK